MRGIRAAGHEADPIGSIRALVHRLDAGDRWDMVFNIAEGVSGMGREAEVPALLEAYGIPCTFSGPDLMALTLNKGRDQRRCPAPAASARRISFW